MCDYFFISLIANILVYHIKIILSSISTKFLKETSCKWKIVYKY